MGTTRRNFFKSIVPQIGPKQLINKTPDVVALGALSSFPVPSTRKVQSFGTEMLVESLPEGLRLLHAASGKNLKLSLGHDGLVRAHLNEIWPPTAVLSILTGEIYNV